MSDANATGIIHISHGCRLRRHIRRKLVNRRSYIKLARNNRHLQCNRKLKTASGRRSVVAVSGKDFAGLHCYGSFSASNQRNEMLSAAAWRRSVPQTIHDGFLPKTTCRSGICIASDISEVTLQRVCVRGTRGPPREVVSGLKSFGALTMGDNRKRHKASLLLLLPDDVFRTILQFLGTPKAMMPLLTSCKGTYQKLESFTRQNIDQERVICSHIKIDGAWKKSSPRSFIIWAKFLGPFRSIHLAADITATYLAFSFVISELLEHSCMSLERLEIDVDERLRVCHPEIGMSFLSRNSDMQNQDIMAIDFGDREGRSYEQMIMWELLGVSDVPYKLSIQRGHIWYHQAIERDVQSSRLFYWSLPYNRHRRTRDCSSKDVKMQCEDARCVDSLHPYYSTERIIGRRLYAPRMPALKEIIISLGPWMNELQTMFDRIFSQLAEVRLLQWCSTLRQIEMPSLSTLTINWHAVDWLQAQVRSAADLETITGRTAQLFETTFLDFMRSLSSLKIFIFSSPLKLPRSLEWHARSVESFAPLWRTVLLGCGHSLQEIHVRGTPAIAAALYKASTFENYYLGVHPEISCPHLRVLSVPTLSNRFEVLDIELFLEKLFGEMLLLTGQSEPVWRFERA